MLIFLGFPEGEKRLLQEAANRLEITDNVIFLEELDRADTALGLYQHTQKTKKYPDVIFLNRDMTGSLSCLKRIKQNPDTRAFPVVALGYFDDAETIRSFYEANGNSYVKKPDKFDDMMRISSEVLSYWQRMTQVPAQHM